MTAAAPTRHTPRFDARWLIEALALAGLYFLTARLGLLLAIPGGHVTPVWPPSGIALAAVLLRGRRVWPGIWLGSFAANFWDFYGSPLSLATELATSATFGIGASLTALLGSQLLRRFVCERNPLERVPDVCAFMALGGVVSCVVSATVGVTSLCLAGFAPWSGYGQAWLTWWLGDTAGVFIVAPLLLVWGGATRRMPAARWTELLGGLVLLIVATYYVFIGNTTVLFTDKRLTFVLVPFLVWAAVRFGQRGAATAAGLIALLAVWGTINGSGPFHLGSRNASLLALELFLSVVSFTALCIAAVVMERRQAESKRRQVLDELESRVAERTASLAQANEALRESETRTQLLIKSSNIGLWDWNLVTKEVFFSLEWKSQLGYSEDEVPDRWEEWESRLHPEDREPSLRAVQDFREGRRKDYDLEFRLRHKDGSWRSILSRADLIREAAGEPVRMMGCHFDITERKQADEALREVHEQLSTIIQKAPLAIVAIDAAGIVQTWNPAAERLFGWKAAEIVGGPILPLVPEEDRRQFEELIAGEIKGEVRVGLELRRLQKDGSLVDVNVWTAPLHNAQNEIVGTIGMFADITERKTIEKALESVEEQYRSIFNNAVDGIFRTSPDGKILVVNPAAARIYGFDTPEKLINERRDIAQQGYVDPRRREEFKRLIEEQGVVNGFEHEAFRKDGSQVWISENTRAVRSPEGELLYFEGTFEDVTDRKRAEEALRWSEQCYRQIVETAGEGIWQLDAENRTTFVNQRMAEMLGYTVAEMEGASMFEFMDEEGKAIAPIYVERRRGGIKERHDFKFRRKDGSDLWAIVSADPIFDAAGQYVGALSLVTDITERQQAEAALRESQTRMQLLVKSSNIGLWDWNVVTNEVFLSPEWKSQLGYADHEMENRFEEWQSRLHPEDREPTLRALNDLRKGRRADYDLEFRLRHKDGSWRSILSRADLILDAAGRPGRMMGCHIDITARKRTEEALESAEEKYRSIFENAVEGIFQTTPDGRFIVANPALARMLGFDSPEELMAARTNIAQEHYVDPQSREVFKQSLAQNGFVRDFELEAYRKDGSKIWISENVRAVRDESGSVLYYEGISEDITERKRAEEDLLASERRYRDIFTFAPVGIYQSLRDGTLITANKALAEMLGYASVDELLRVKLGSGIYLAEEEREKLIRENEGLGYGVDHDMQWKRKDGSPICVQLSVHVIKGPKGETKYFEGFVRDITKRKRTEQARERGLSLMLATLESTADGILVVNTEGKIETFNRIFGRMWRLPDEVLAPKEDARVLECVLDQLVEPEQFLEKVSYLYHHPEEESFDRLLFKDGRVFERYSRPQLIGGEVAGRVWSFRDITERNQAREALQKANRQLQSLSRRLFQVQEQEKRHLARELHDEIGQALTAVKINLTFLGTANGDDSLRLEETIALLDNLLQQVRQISLDLHPSLLDDLGLAAALRSLLDQQARRAGLRAQFCAAQLRDNIRPVIETTAFRIAQEAITNVLRHAKASLIKVQLRTEAGRLRIEVADDGAGFDVAEARQRSHQEVGFGLMGMKERAALVGGEVEVISSRDMGTRVQISLPLKENGSTP